VSAHNAVGYVLAFIAAFFAGANVVGGYAVTGRMLKMFRRKAPEQDAPETTAALNGHKGLKGMLSRMGKAQS
jgi:NAD(P) transhydrogenase subunit alpha